MIVFDLDCCIEFVGWNLHLLTVSWLGMGDGSIARCFGGDFDLLFWLVDWMIVLRLLLLIVFCRLLVGVWLVVCLVCGQLFT